MQERARQTRGDHLTVLLVDDDGTLLEFMAQQLERADDRLATVTVGTATDALDRLEAAPIDCIVSDYQMPGTDGLGFLEEVRASGFDLPFILYTGKGSEEIAARAINAGVDGYLQKETGTAQYTVLANRIVTLAEKYSAERQLNDLATGGSGRSPRQLGSVGGEPRGSQGGVTPVSLAVTEAVATHEGVEPTALPPLSETIDSDALDRLFSTRPSAASEGPETVTFPYHGYTVTVESDGSIALDE